MPNPREQSYDRTILMALSEMGATRFYESLARVCTKIVLECGERERVVRNVWVGLSSSASANAQRAEAFQMGSPFIIKRE